MQQRVELERPIEVGFAVEDCHADFATGFEQRAEFVGRGHGDGVVACLSQLSLDGSEFGGGQRDGDGLATHGLLL